MTTVVYCTCHLEVISYAIKISWRNYNLSSVILIEDKEDREIISFKHLMIFSVLSTAVTIVKIHFHKNMKICD